MAFLPGGSGMPGDGILVQTFPQFAGSVGLVEMVPGDLHPLNKRRRQVGNADSGMSHPDARTVVAVR
jgi:hypothetical protein